MNIAEKDLEVFLESLIVLIDKPNKGKTAAMRKFAYELLARKGVSYVHPRSVPANLKKDGKDFTLVVEISGVRVGIISAGDGDDCIFHAVKVFAKYECRIGIMVVSEPARIGGSKLALDAYKRMKTKCTAKITEIEKRKIKGSTFEEANEATAQKLLTVLDSELKCMEKGMLS